jgi:hypothetical protein
VCAAPALSGVYDIYTLLRAFHARFFMPAGFIMAA